VRSAIVASSDQTDEQIHQHVKEANSKTWQEKHALTIKKTSEEVWSCWIKVKTPTKEK